MKLTIVRFACYDTDKAELLALSEKQCDRWHECEPQEGYHLFEEVGEAELSDEAVEAVIGSTMEDDDA